MSSICKSSLPLSHLFVPYLIYFVNMIVLSSATSYRFLQTGSGSHLIWRAHWPGCPFYLGQLILGTVTGVSDRMQRQIAAALEEGRRPT